MCTTTRSPVPKRQGARTAPGRESAGTGGVVVMDDSVCTVRAAAVIARFFRHETCGQCTQCREGTQGSVNEPREREEHGMAFNEKWTYRAPRRDPAGAVERIIYWHLYD